MKSILRLMLLPVQAPMLLLLCAVSTYLGMHWSRPITVEASELASLGTLVWSAECLQALVVVVVCTMPDLLLRQISSLMAASRVVSLVVTLLLVITGGLYLLHLDVLSNVLILASTVLLARLDLVRIRVLPPPLLMAALLSLLVLGGAGLGRVLEARYEPLQAPLARVVIGGLLTSTVWRLHQLQAGCLPHPQAQIRQVRIGQSRIGSCPASATSALRRRPDSSVPVPAVAGSSRHCRAPFSHTGVFLDRESPPPRARGRAGAGRFASPAPPLDRRCSWPRPVRVRAAIAGAGH